MFNLAGGAGVPQGGPHARDLFFGRSFLYRTIILSTSPASPTVRSNPKILKVYLVNDSGKKVSNTYPFSAPYLFAKPVSSTAADVADVEEHARG
jgi:hypothetical protein